MLALFADKRLRCCWNMHVSASFCFTKTASVRDVFHGTLPIQTSQVGVFPVPTPKPRTQFGFPVPFFQELQHLQSFGVQLSQKADLLRIMTKNSNRFLNYNVRRSARVRRSVGWTDRPFVFQIFAVVLAWIDWDWLGKTSFKVILCWIFLHMSVHWMS
jgi:hypothetical protein